MGYNIQDMGRKTWWIDCYGAVSMYLIEGDEKAMLIDTGAGVGDLAGAVKQLTDKPVFVVNTHGHGDHTGGNGQFDEIYVSSVDFDAACKEFTYDQKVNYAKSRVGLYNPAMVEQAVASIIKDLPVKTPIKVENGHVFELGNRPVEVILTPGHSAGSICLLDKKYNQIFTGDMVNFMTLVYRGFSAPLDVYIRSIEGLIARSGEFDRLLRGHQDPVGTVEDMKTLVEIARGVYDGSNMGEYREVGIRKGWVAEKGRFQVWHSGPEGAKNDIG